MQTQISKEEFEKMFSGFDDNFLNTVNNDEESILSETNRDWKIIYRNSEVIGFEANLRILLKSRNDQAMEFIPERLYSSLKYQVEHEMESIAAPILLVKMQVIDPKTEEEILVDDNSILMGNPEGVLTLNSSGKHFLKCKVHFSDVHHDKRNYALRVCYYLPHDLMKPVLIVKSPEFKIYTRRNNGQTKLTSTKKRTRETTETEKLPEVKKHKIDLSEYLNQLQDLLQMKNKLPKDEQNDALDLAISKLKPQESSIPTQISFDEELSSMTFEDIFTPKDCSTYDALMENFDFGLCNNNEIGTCIF